MVAGFLVAYLNRDRLAAGIHWETYRGSIRDNVAIGIYHPKEFDTTRYAIVVKVWRQLSKFDLHRGRIHRQ